MKTVLVGILALALGAGSGALIMGHMMEAQIAAAEQERDATRTKLQEAAEEAKTKADRAILHARDLEQDNQVLQQRLRMMSEKTPGDAAASEQDEIMETPPPETRSAPAGNVDHFGPESRQYQDSESTGPEAEAERERRTFARERIRERLDSFLQDEAERNTDPEVQQRLAQIKDYTEQLSELRKSMRNAPPDERAEVRENMREIMGALHEVGETQQDYMVREVARQFDINDPEEQEAFVGAVRDLQSSPFFRPESLVWGANRRAFRDFTPPSR